VLAFWFPGLALEPKDLSKDKRLEGSAGVAFLEQASRLEKASLLTLVVTTQMKLERAREAAEQAKHARASRA
jgi:hypothetical protein